MPAQNQSQVPVGTILEGKFRITKEIGRGGMAAVYEAENVDIGKRVAVKILAAELITSRVVRERFIREARAAAAIRSPYICDVYDSGMFEERPFLVMELLEGESLYDMMTRVRQIDVETTVRITTHTARGLAKAHESNVVHRDLKPENIFLTKEEDGKLVVKIVDFGLAKFYEPTSSDMETVRLTREGALFGTPAYMSPEQAKGKGEVDHRADLWALGCIVYECLTGQTVWNVEQGVAMILAQIASAPLPKPSKLRPDLPPAFDAWFARALDRDPDKRYQNAKELADGLARALTPNRAPARSMSISSDDEGMVVDELIASETFPVSDPRASNSPPTTREMPAAPLPAPPPPPAPIARPAPVLSERPERGSGRAISILMLVSALSLGAYAVWLYALHPPSQPTIVHSSTPAKPHASGTAPTAAVTSGPRPVETDAYALKLGHAQELLASGDSKDALEAFKDAVKGNAPVARSVLSHMSIAIEEPSGPCKLTGISRPRPYSIDLPVSRPTLLHSSAGTVFVWIDNHQDAKKRQAYAVLLDDALRRTTPEVSLTPEASSARQAQLIAAGDKFILLYWDDGGNEPGVYARFVTHDGHIAGPSHLISSVKKGDLYAAIAPSEGGKYWVAWQEEVDKGTSDIVGRELDGDLQPTGDPIRMTAVFPAKASTTAAGTPSIAVHNGNLNVAFSINRGLEHYQINALRIPLSDPTLKTGLVAQKKASGKERFLGQVQILSSATGKNTTPVIACTDPGCFVAWDDEKAGASVAFLDKDKGQMLWHRDLPNKTVRPAVAANGNSAVLAWFDESRLKFSQLTRDGLGAISTLSRVSGFQPQPDMAAGEKPGQWYISWRDYESAHLEVFALRTDCP
ncbi:MAG TPA: serine/threonine-protein kinase [Polyangiaceae bacterium]|jgi:serine/threonine-protein kinase|nr:serine/threonine-protein kinase [Polyangiaceae bacterium]